eukprot:jgi/Ulvmu1/4480/UM002_0205.1
MICAMSPVNSLRSSLAQCSQTRYAQRASKRTTCRQCVLAKAHSAEPAMPPRSISVPAQRSGHEAADSVDTDEGVTYSYHSEGHYKATLEDVFKNPCKASLIRNHAPWSMGWQTNERNIMWNDDLKIRLIKKIVAQKTELSNAELERRLQTLVILLPDICARLPSMKPAILSRLLIERQAVAERLLALKQIFPGADCSKMLAKELGLLSETIDSLEQRAADLREFLPAADIDKLVQDNPSILSVDTFMAAVQDARRLMPGIHIESLMMSQPDFVLSLQKGTDMIPYDPIPENPWGHK